MAYYGYGILRLWHTTAMAYYGYGMLHIILNIVLYVSCYSLYSTMLYALPCSMLYHTLCYVLYATCSAMLYTICSAMFYITCPIFRALYSLFSVYFWVCVLARITSIYNGSEDYEDDIELRNLLVNILVSIVTLRVYDIALRNSLVNIYGKFCSGEERVRITHSIILSYLSNYLQCRRCHSK